MLGTGLGTGTQETSSGLGMLPVTGLMSVGTGLPWLCWEFPAASYPLLCDLEQRVSPLL